MFWETRPIPAPKRANAELKALEAVAELDPRRLTTLAALVQAVEDLGFTAVELDAAEDGVTLIEWTAPLAGHMDLLAHGVQGLSEPERVGLLLGAARKTYDGMRVDMEENGWTDSCQARLLETVEQAFHGPMTTDALAATKVRAMAALQEAMNAVLAL